MRDAEGLVQVEVQDVHAQVAGAGGAEHGVHVGPVHVDQAADRVHRVGNLQDALLEQPERVGVGDHQPRDLVVQRLLQRAEVEVATRAGRHRARAVADHGDGGGVGAVGGVGHQHRGALAAGGLMPGADDQRPGQFAVGARGGLQRHRRQPGDLAQPLLQFAEQIQHAGHGGLILVGVDQGQARQIGDAVVDLGVVLHGARAERVEALVDGEVAPRGVGEVAHYLRLRQLRQRQRVAQQRGRERRGARHVEGRKLHPPTTGDRLLEQQRLVRQQPGPGRRGNRVHPRFVSPGRSGPVPVFRLSALRRAVTPPPPPGRPPAARCRRASSARSPSTASSRPARGRSVPDPGRRRSRVLPRATD